MSAGRQGEYPGEPAITVVRSLDVLAPKFREYVLLLLEECETEGLDAMVHESYRSRATAQVYYARGRTTIPPERTVSAAPDETYSWHGYGLAVDIISKSKLWSAPPSWWTTFGHLAEDCGLRWGGRWPRADLPHVQFGRCKDTPSDHARELLKQGGMRAVWDAVGAI